MRGEPKQMAVRAAMGAVVFASMLCPTGPVVAAEPLLGARNTFIALRDGSVDVVLPRDIDLPLKERSRAEGGPAPWITFDGGGRAVGIVLMPRGADDAVTRGLVAAQFRSCRRQCPERPVNALMINGALFRGSETLPAGAYRLYVFTDRKATITLELPQLTGGAKVLVGEPGFADTRTPVVAVDHRDGITAYSAKASFEMKGHTGIFMSVNVLRDPRYRDASFDECLSPDHVGPDELEHDYCSFPTGFRFVRPLDPTKIQPKRGGFILLTFVALSDRIDNLFNGDSSLQHYSYRVVSPGLVGELWSQGVLLSF